jgi:predicted GNAT family N-acyltransferase
MEIRLFTSQSPEYKAALELRHRLLRAPLGLTFAAEDIAAEASQKHLGLYDGDRLIGNLTIVDNNSDTLKLRQFAIDEAWQGKGLSYILMEAAEKYARDNGYKKVYGHARKSVVPIYIKMGYYTVGDEFEEVTIPHMAIEKVL